jgi:hypothetical protein
LNLFFILNIDEKQNQPPPAPPYKEGGGPNAKTEPDIAGIKGIKGIKPSDLDNVKIFVFNNKNLNLFVLFLLYPLYPFHPC